VIGRVEFLSKPSINSDAAEKPAAEPAAVGAPDEGIPF